MAEFLSGKYVHQLDDRGRLRIPTKFKDILGTHPFVTLGVQGKQNCLIVYSAEDAQKTFFDRFAGLDEFSDDPLLDRMRIMLSNGKVLEEDKQGRVTIPQELLDKVGIAKNIVSVGMLNRMEIWGEEEWDKYDKSVNLKECLRKSN